MFISPPFRNIANYIFRNLTPSAKWLRNETEKNNAYIPLIKFVFIIRFVRLTSCKTNLNCRT